MEHYIEEEIVEVVCDNCCHYEEKEEGVSKTKFIKEMRKKGWRIGEYCFCPECHSTIGRQRGVSY